MIFRPDHDEPGARLRFTRVFRRLIFLGRMYERLHRMYQHQDYRVDGRVIVVHHSQVSHRLL